MKTTNKTLIAVFFAYLLTLAGCGILIRPVQVVNRDLSQWAVDDPNIIGLTIIKNPDETITYRYSTEFNSDPVNTIPFGDWEYNFLKIPIVRGQINGKTYPMAFDTGNSVNAAIIEDIHVHDNNLPLVFLDDSKHPGIGMALVSDFEVGSLNAQNVPCMFLKNHTAIKFLGIPIWRSRHVIIHLQLMAQFKYFEFDQIKKVIRFSHEYSFEPENPLPWLTFPFEIKNNRILLSIPLEDVDTTWFLDTGDSGELELGETLIAQLFEQRPDFEEKFKQNTWGYSPYGEGFKKGKIFTTRQLNFGNHILKEARISYGRKTYKDESFQGMIGFKLFEKTIMVLDFEKNVMWVKKAKGSRFEE